MVKLKWIENGKLDNILVRQVYGVAFNEKGRVILKCDHVNGKDIYSLAGGTPENYDKQMTDTLKREFLEEINTSLKDKFFYLGYQEVDEQNGVPKYAQVRMVAVIESIGESKPDIDNGRTYKRVLVSPKMAIKLLQWGDIGERIVTLATTIAIEHFNILPAEDEDIIYV